MNGYCVSLPKGEERGSEIETHSRVGGETSSRPCALGKWSGNQRSLRKANESFPENRVVPHIKFEASHFHSSRGFLQLQLWIRFAPGMDAWGAVNWVGPFQGHHVLKSPQTLTVVSTVTPTLRWRGRDPHSHTPFLTEIITRKVHGQRAHASFYSKPELFSR